VAWKLGSLKVKTRHYERNLRIVGRGLKPSALLMRARLLPTTKLASATLTE